MCDTPTRDLISLRASFPDWAWKRALEISPFAYTGEQIEDCMTTLRIHVSLSRVTSQYNSSFTTGMGNAYTGIHSSGANVVDSVNAIIEQI